MEIRFASSPGETAFMDTEALRRNFLISNLFRADQINLTHSHYDRLIIGGAKPVDKEIHLPVPEELKANYFLERREMGIINVGGSGVIKVDGELFSLDKLDALYIGRGKKEISFSSINAAEPALFYILSAPAHQNYPTTICTKENAASAQLGTVENANQRVVYKYIHLEGLKSCQLVMGLTVLATGSVWNSMPPHTHTRRMEVYFYFDLPETQRIFHFMGEAQQTRHIVAANLEALISPPWSTHFGCGTSSYGFIWGMAGENLAYTDMDLIPTHTIK